MIDNLLVGFGLVLQLKSITYVIVGSIIGILVGAMPGLSASTGVALMLPFTFGMSAMDSLILLCSLYTSAEYGGSISAICISTPGTPAAVATVFDGYALTKKGEPGKALGISLICGTFAGMFSTVTLILLSVPLAEFALKFGPPEYFSLGVFGLTIISSLASESLLKGFIAMMIGLLLNTIGIDTFSAYPRFTFGTSELSEGIALIPALIGLFAVSEVFVIAEEIYIGELPNKDISSKLPSRKELKSLIPATIRGTIIGNIVGIIPGAGGAIASLIAYDQEKRISKNPEMFGKGALEGVAAPEAANNSVVGGALVPLLTLGIPGSATTAVLIGALMIHGLTPGPHLFEKNTDVVYGLFASLFLANLAMLLLGLVGVKLWVKVISIPRGMLLPLILSISFIGSFAIGSSLFNVGSMLTFGIIGYILRKFKFPVAPIVLALVLGFMLEANLRRSLLISGGSYWIFFSHPISLFLLILAAISFLGPLIKRWHKKKIC